MASCLEHWIPSGGGLIDALFLGVFIEVTCILTIFYSGLEGDFQRTVQQRIPIKSREPILLHDGASPSLGPSQTFGLVCLEELFDQLGNASAKV